MKATAISILAVGAVLAEENPAVTPAVTHGVTAVRASHLPVRGALRGASPYFGARFGGHTRFTGAPVHVRAPVVDAPVKAEPNEALEYNSDLQDEKINYVDAVNTFKGLDPKDGGVDTTQARKVYDVADELSKFPTLKPNTEAVAAARAAYQAAPTEELNRAFKQASATLQNNKAEVTGILASRLGGLRTGAIAIADVLAAKTEYESEKYGDDVRKTREKQGEYMAKYVAFTKRANDAFKESTLYKALERNNNFISVDDTAHDYKEAKEALLAARDLYSKDQSAESRKVLEAAMIEFKKQNLNRLNLWAGFLQQGTTFGRLISLRSAKANLEAEVFGAGLHSAGSGAYAGLHHGRARSFSPYAGRAYSPYRISAHTPSVGGR